jgi:hypothetical protein
MKKLMLDHFRRWWWVLALVGLLEFRLGWSIANRPQDPFEFWAFLLALWVGANLLSFDFKRGALRPVAVLPLTARRIGRTWWLATVPLPAIGLTALLFLGAATLCHFHPNRALPTKTLAIASLFTLVWLGTGFPMTFSATRGFGRNLWAMNFNFLVSVLSVLVVFGSMLFGQGAAKSPVKCALLLGVGSFLTVVGWADAERFDLSRAVQFWCRGSLEPGKLSRAAAGLARLEPKFSQRQHLAPSGYGGLPFLISTSFVRMFLYLAVMTALTALLSYWTGQAIPRRIAIVTFAGVWSLMSCGFIIVFQLLPLVRQLRWLRTLPISATRLSVVLIVITILPLIAVGTVAVGVAGFAFGTPAAVTFLNSYTFALAPASLCVFLVVWLGEGRLAYTLLIITLFGVQQVQLRIQLSLHLLELPFSLAGPIAATSVLLSLLLTACALRYSRHVYRARAVPFGSFPFGVGG